MSSIEGSPVISRESVLTILRDESLKRRRATRNLRICIVFLNVLTIASEIVRVAKGHPFDWTNLIVLLLLIPAGVSMGMSPSHKLTAKAATELNDLRAVGGLIEVLDCGEPELVRIAEQALLVLLPLIKEEDANLIDEAQEAVLVAGLNRTSNAEFYAVGVGALRFVGTRRTLGALDAFASIAPAQLKDKAQAESLAKMAAADLRIRLAKTQIQAEAQAEGARLEEVRQRILE
jgi:hypothetical protein